MKTNHYTAETTRRLKFKFVSKLWVLDSFIYNLFLGGFNTFRVRRCATLDVGNFRGWFSRHLQTGRLCHSLVNICTLSKTCILLITASKSGIVKRRWGPPVKGKRVEVTLALQAHHVTINNIPDFGIGPRARRTNFESFWRTRREDELRGRDVILRSFSPEVRKCRIRKLNLRVLNDGDCRFTDSTW